MEPRGLKRVNRCADFVTRSRGALARLSIRSFVRSLACPFVWCEVPHSVTGSRARTECGTSLRADARCCTVRWSRRPPAGRPVPAPPRASRPVPGRVRGPASPRARRRAGPWPAPAARTARARRRAGPPPVAREGDSAPPNVRADLSLWRTGRRGHLRMCRSRGLVRRRSGLGAPRVARRDRTRDGGRGGCCGRTVATERALARHQLAAEHDGPVHVHRVGEFLE